MAGPSNACMSTYQPTATPHMDQRSTQESKHDVPLRVSIVEDEPSIRETLSGLLRMEEGLELVRAYPNAEAAVGRASRRMMPELVLMDIGLPGMSGIELLSAAHPGAGGTHTPSS
jgi:CheY-like chemotaxis protein